MTMKGQLTTEKLRKLYTNHFQMVNDAIEIAREHVKSGVEFNIDRVLEELLAKHEEQARDDDR